MTSRNEFVNLCAQTYLIKNRMQRTNPTRINIGATDRPIVVVLSEEKNFHDKNTFSKKGRIKWNLHDLINGIVFLTDLRFR